MERSGEEGSGGGENDIEEAVGGRSDAEGWSSADAE